MSASDANPQGDELTPLSAADTTMYRAVVARINCLSQDLAELLYATKEVSRHMSALCKGDMGPIEMIGRFHLGMPRSVTLFEWQDTPAAFTIYADSSWVACKGTRKSTSGSVTMQL